MNENNERGAILGVAGVRAADLESLTPQVCRVSAQTPVLVYGSGEQGEPFYAEGVTINIWAQGTLLSMPRSVAVGQSILLINPGSGKEVVCHVQSVEPDGTGLNQADIEFLEASPLFWGIEFSTPGDNPAENQTPHSPAHSGESNENGALQISSPADDSTEQKTSETFSPAGDAAQDDLISAQLANEIVRSETFESSDPESLGQMMDTPLDMAPESRLDANSELEETDGGSDEIAEPQVKTDIESPDDTEREVVQDQKTPAAEATGEISKGAAVLEITEVVAAPVRAAIRRGRRVHLQVSVLVGLVGEPSQEQCKTVEIGAFGALLELSRNVEVGQSLVLTNPKSLKRMTCSVRNSKRTKDGSNHVGVEFADESSKFWGMTFPADDWDSSQRKLPQRRLLRGDVSQSRQPNRTVFEPVDRAHVPEVSLDSNSILRAKVGNVSNKPVGLSTEPDIKPSGNTGLGSPRETEAVGIDETAGPAIHAPTEGGSAFPGPKRRSQRILLQVPVLIGLAGEPSQEECETVEIGAFGALLVLSRNVDIGQSLVLTNPQSLLQLSCFVRNSKRMEDGSNCVAVEFAAESNKFWGMTFPTDDWDSSERKLLQGPISPNDLAFRSLPGHSATRVEKNSEPPAKEISTPTKTFKRPAIILAGLMGLILIVVAATHKSNTDSVQTARSIFLDVDGDEAHLIPGIEKFRIATLGDFDPDAVSWLEGIGEHADGKVSGNFSASGQSRVYLLIGKDNLWRIVILANGQLRCDAQYKSVAIVVRVPRESVHEINWADPPPSDLEGDGLLVVRAANDFGTSVVLFLRGGQVVSGTPSDYRQIPLGPTR
jgi:hypothetical protein